MITGGAGFIGSNLAADLCRRGEKVAIIDDLSAGRRDYLPPEAEFYHTDITDKEEVRGVFQKERERGGVDHVYHLAAQIDVRVSVGDPRLDNKVNVLGGLNILENCYEYGISKVIFTSTGGALYSEDSIPATEEHPPQPISPYGIHKFAFEHYLNYYYYVFGQEYTVLRLANVYGPRQFKGGEAGVITIFIDNAVRGEGSVLYGDGKQTRDFVYVDDVVKALEGACVVDFVGSLNIGRGREVDLWEVVAMIEKALGEKMTLKQEPARAGELRRSCLDPSRAREILDWRPEVDLQSGVQRTIDWSKRNK